MSKRTRLVILAAVVALFIAATAIKHILNGLGDAMHGAYNRPTSISVADARGKGVLLAEFAIEPRAVSDLDMRYEFGEAWLEAAYRPRHFLIWFSYAERAEWGYFCIRPKTHWHQGAYSYSLWPAYPPDFERTGTGMAHTAGNASPELHFQRAPNGLDAADVIVSAYTYEAGHEATLGAVRMRRLR